ncbi:MAG: hypothetical protein JO189_03630 [Deltaproteobacteria bacterium]|nr:hypothetical protein [Deltaproteobacteria bacterium]
MTSISYILSRLSLTWLGAPPLIVFATLIYDTVLFGSRGATPQAILLAVLLFYFVIYTWPVRWLLDIIILLFFLTIAAQGVQQGQFVIKDIAHAPQPFPTWSAPPLQ